MIRQGCDYAYVELVFSVTDEKKRRELAAREVCPDADGNLIISKKIMPSRSISRIKRRDGDSRQASGNHGHSH